VQQQRLVRNCTGAQRKNAIPKAARDDQILAVDHRVAKFVSRAFWFFWGRLSQKNRRPRRAESLGCGTHPTMALAEGASSKKRPPKSGHPYFFSTGVETPTSSGSLLEAIYFFCNSVTDSPSIPQLSVSTSSIMTKVVFGFFPSTSASKSVTL